VVDATRFLGRARPRDPRRRVGADGTGTETARANAKGEGCRERGPTTRIPSLVPRHPRFFSIGNSSDAFLLLRARDLGVPIGSLPLLWSALHVSKLVSSYAGGRVADRIARSKVIVVGWIVYAITYLGLGLATEASRAWALFVVYGTYYGLTEPAEKAMVRDVAPPHLRGRAYGFYNFVIGATAVPASALTGWLWQTWSPLAALAMGAAIAATSAVALVFWSAARFSRIGRNTSTRRS
jgi:MFS family permease